MTAQNGVTFRYQGNAAIGTPITLTQLNPGGSPPSSPLSALPLPGQRRRHRSRLRRAAVDGRHRLRRARCADHPAQPDSVRAARLGRRSAPGQPAQSVADRGDRQPRLNGWAALDRLGDRRQRRLHARGPTDLDTVTVGSSSQNPYLPPARVQQRRRARVRPVHVLRLRADWRPSDPARSSRRARSTRATWSMFDGVGHRLDADRPERQGYRWNFGDGTHRHRPERRAHASPRAACYTVTLTVTDRGGNTATESQTVTVLGPAGQTPTPPTTQPMPGNCPRAGAAGPPPAGAPEPEGRAPNGIGSSLGVNPTSGERASSPSRSRGRGQAGAHQARRWPERGDRARHHCVGSRTAARSCSCISPKGVAAKLKKLGHATLHGPAVAGGRRWGSHLTIDAAGRY